MENDALIVAAKLDVAVVFSDKGMAKLLDEIKAKVIAHVPDTKTETGRKDITSLAYKITRSKTLIDDLGKGLVSDWKKKAKLIDGHRKAARDFLDDLKATARQPLTVWEEEQAKIQAEEDLKEKEKIDDRIAALLAVKLILPFFEIAQLDDNCYEKLLAEKTEAYEAEQNRFAEEEAIRKAENERLAMEQVKQEKKAKELADKEATIRAEQEAESAKLKEVRDKIIAEQKKAQDKIDAERKALEDEKKAERDKVYREAFEKQVVEDARIKAEKDVKDKAERESLEKVEAERKANEEVARKAKLLPDKEKLLSYGKALMDVSVPEIKNLKAKEILNEATSAVYGILKKIHKQTEEL